MILPRRAPSTSTYTIVTALFSETHEYYHKVYEIVRFLEQQNLRVYGVGSVSRRLTTPKVQLYGNIPKVQSLALWENE